MRLTKMFFTAAILLLAITVGVQAQSSSDPRFTEEKLKQIDQNLVRSLESSIPGVQASAAQTVRQIKACVPEYSFSYKVTNALMGIVKNESAPTSSRILAAMALHDLNSSIGDYAIKMEARFTDSPRLKHLFTWLSYNRSVEQRMAAAKRSGEAKDLAAK